MVLLLLRTQLFEILINKHCTWREIYILECLIFLIFFWKNNVKKINCKSIMIFESTNWMNSFLRLQLTLPIHIKDQITFDASMHWQDCNRVFSLVKSCKTLQKGHTNWMKLEVCKELPKVNYLLFIFKHVCWLFNWNYLQTFDINSLSNKVTNLWFKIHYFKS